MRWATFGPDGTTTTDTVSNDGSPEQIVVTAPRPGSSTPRPPAAPDTAPPAESSPHSGFRWSDLWPISSAQAQEEAEGKDPFTGKIDERLEEIVRENFEKLDVARQLHDREIREEKADFPTTYNNEQLRKATEPKPGENPLLPIPDSYASRLAPLRGPPAAPTEPAPRAGASGTAAATATEETSPAPRLPPEHSAGLDESHEDRAKSALNSGNATVAGPTPGTAIQTYWPLNGGFLGTSVPQTLSPGYQFSRYGGFFDSTGTFRDFGNFVAPSDVPLEMRSLPPVSGAARPLTTYEVIRPIYDVPTGLAAPAFGKFGLGTQYQLPMTIQDYLDQGYIRIVNQNTPERP